MAYTSRFEFVGEASIPNDKEKFVKKWEGGANNNTPMAKLNFWVKFGPNSSIMVTKFGMQRDVIKTKNLDRDNIEVKWEDRFDEDVLKNIPLFCKNIVSINGERKEFLSEYDFIEYLENILPEHDGKIKVRGQFTKNPYNGRVYDDFEISSVYDTSEDNKPEIIMDYYYNHDCLDFSEYESNGKITVNGYIKQYVNKDEGEKFFPQQMVLNAGKLKENLLKHLMKRLDIKSKEIYHIPWKTHLMRGAEEMEFDESMLTDEQKDFLEAGLYTINDIQKGVYSENIYEFRMIVPLLTDEFADGPIESGYTLDSILDEVYSQPENISISELEEEIEESDDSELKSEAEFMDEIQAALEM